jgi:positive regulator of sigma E activity
MKQAKPSKLHVWSAPLLLRIHALPRYVFPLFTLVLLLLGLFLSNGVLGGIFLLLLGLALGWLIALSWQLLTPSAKLMRAILLFVVVGYAVSRMAGRA